MSTFKKLSAKAEEANASLAQAFKEWKDENISRREQLAINKENELRTLKIDIDQKLKEISDLESRRAFRKISYILCFIFGALPAFFLGLLVSDVGPSVEGYESVTATLPSEGGKEAPARSAGSSYDSSPSELGICVQRGVEYFKEIGSYPTLRAPPEAGRAAETVAEERCKRSLSAFGSP
ncbi:hypothetical protein [Sandarakinorhabdus rubra]|uniref:hypothetical protein n=1 Tax=Sandarakinorhabdus rubra TaxID=2672568 RepID=UPI0013DA6E7B|nr:hypothetical protein [Sandarakinorhabdus rubra]